MGIDRRHFLSGAAMAGLGLVAGRAGLPATAEESAGQAELRISSQEGRIPGATLEEKLDRMEQWGIVGLEVGGGGLPDRVEALKKALAGRQVKVSAICAGFRGVLISEEEVKRQEAVASISEILQAAGELGAVGLIVVPAFNGQTKLGNQEARQVLLDLLPGLGEVAVKAGTTLLLEPLNRGEAFFLRQLADAAAICRDAKHPGVCMMADFYHMGHEETSHEGAILSAGKYLRHVHLATWPGRVLPGQEEYDYTSGFRGLKRLAYRGYCSLEWGCNGGPQQEIPKSVRFLRQQWEQA